ncbi:uncharacterized protein LOC130902905 [Diorhabda carinulata]|uniref:uncharacterized protein LOC130902905 n=1 Tax=Diorhabda carinulata TaxID=1163345 RepID=UPI0025A2E37C|nr:uncharacterized protein LOC130902905 [Diorhabda carinulata]
MKFMSKDEDEFSCPYQQAIGSLLYVAQGTPDICFAVNTLSRFNKKPNREHCYCDADWASDLRDRKSCSGYLFMLQGGAISWRSQKQQTVALSTAEAEYMAMSSAAQEVLWLQQLHEELAVQLNNPFIIYSDNQSAIKLTTNDCYLPRSKNIDIRYHFLKSHVNNLKIKFLYIKVRK